MSGVSIAQNMLQNMFSGDSVAVRRDGVYRAVQVEASLVQSQFAVTSAADISALGEFAAKRIADASLSKEQKESLIRLAAYINENGSDPGLFRDLMGLVRLMEMNNTQAESYRMTEQEALEMFKNEQNDIRSNNAVLLSVGVAFAQFESQYLGAISPQSGAGTAEDSLRALGEIFSASGFLPSPLDIYA